MKTIAVIFGGRSTEHDVSIVTALASIIKPLELTKKYKVMPVYIDRSGTWYWHDKLKNIDLYTSGEIDAFLQKLQPLQLGFDGGLQLLTKRGVTKRDKTINIDIAFPALHGTFGEDGSLMGVLRMANIPFVGCDMDAAVLAMDKVLAKQIVASHDIPVTNYEYLHAHAFIDDSKKYIKQIEASLSYPLFVKPAHLGSSIGISRATNTDELNNAIEVAAHYDSKVLIEEEVKNLVEVTLPIMGNEALTPAMLERPLTTADDFFDFETKYMQGGKKGAKGTKGAQGYSEVPAKLDKKLYDKAVAVGEQAYKALGCSGIARVDMLIDSKTNEVYFNEVNPLPGGLYAHNWNAAGMSGVQLVEKLVDLAEARFSSQQKLNTVFDTNYLKQF